jgi:hypothetical protein
MEIISSSFELGVYAGGQAGTDSGMTAGPADDPQRTICALNELQGQASSFLVRCYAGYHGRIAEARPLPEATESYVSETRKLDLVLCFQTDDDDMTGWRKFISAHIERYGTHIRYLQITEEANVNLPSLDGYFSNSRKALVDGIIHAKKVIKNHGYSIQVGFNATLDFSPNRTFWKEIKQLASLQFYESLDYVGLDLFPGVFRPLPSYEPARVEKLISSVVQAFRKDVTDAGITEHIPLHITENGFATANDKSEEDQANMLSMIISILFNMRMPFNIRTYELFALRDANSKVDDVFHQLGIMRDDYTPKRAFYTFSELIRLHSVG